MRDRTTLIVAATVGILIVIGGIWVYTMVFDAQTPGTEPVEPVWGKDVCASCQMHVTEPGFATQAHLAHGGTVFFDDPGCYFKWAPEHDDITHVWFHHSSENRWVSASDVGFSKVESSPMGFGLAAVDLKHPGALTVAAVQQLLAPAPAQPPRSTP